MFLYFLVNVVRLSDIIPDRSLVLTSDQNIYFLSLLIFQCWKQLIAFHLMYKQLGKRLNWF